ncbi:MAG TPA: hypothetical protein VF292_05430 [Rhodanobacteraceae bacterium]
MYTGTLLVYDASVARLGLRQHGKPPFFPFTDQGVTMLAAPVRELGFSGHAVATSAATVYFAGKNRKNPVHQPDGMFDATVGTAFFAHSVLTLGFYPMTMDVEPSN